MISKGLRDPAQTGIVTPWIGAMNHLQQSKVKSMPRPVSSTNMHQRARPV